MDKPKKKKIGRPTTYKEEYAEEILEYFQTWPKYRTVEKVVASAGKAIKVYEEKANYPPTLTKWATARGLSRQQLIDWGKANKSFLDALHKCKRIYEDFLVDHGLVGDYNNALTKFMLINTTDLRDRVEHVVTDAKIKIEKKDEDL